MKRQGPSGNGTAGPKRWIVAAVLVVLFGGAVTQAAKSSRATVVYVMRHAEKKDNSSNPSISSVGRRRAEALGRMLRNQRVSAIYATKYVRTQQTVWFLSKWTKLKTRVYSESPREFARVILKRHAGETIVVAGHSNTVPNILRGLGVARPPKLTERDYGDLFMVVVKSGRARLIHGRYGKP